MASNPCAACKVLKCECTTNCIFAPYFPSTKPMKFEQVHRIFGAETIYKILSNLQTSEREYAVNALCYEAEARERDPISGCVGMFLHHQKDLESLQEKIKFTKNELVTTVGPDKIPPFYDLPIPSGFLSTQSSSLSFIGETKGLNEVQMNQLMQLSPADAQKIVDEAFGKRKDQEMCDGHGAASASTSTRPSTSAGSSKQKPTIV